MLTQTETLASVDDNRSGETSGERLSQRAYQAIRTSLRLGELRPGEKLILRPLAVKLKLSATPVREALLRLVSEQALGLDDRSSVVVPTLDVNDLDEIRELRIDLEGRAAELAAAKGQAAVLANLDAIRSRFEAAQRNGDRHEANWQDDRFHREILLAAGRPMLVKLVENLQVRTGPLMAIAALEQGTDGRAGMHASMVAAIGERDGTAGRAAVTEGLEALFAQLRAAVLQSEREDA